MTAISIYTRIDRTIGGDERSFAIEVGDEGDTEGEVIRARYRFTLGEVRTKERRHQLDEHRVEIGDVYIETGAPS